MGRLGAGLVLGLDHLTEQQLVDAPVVHVDDLDLEPAQLQHLALVGHARELVQHQAGDGVEALGLAEVLAQRVGQLLTNLLTNALRHGQAKNIIINLSFTPTEIMLSILDDGSGSDDLKPGFGLTAMQQRLAALHGILEYQSEKGKGTQITCLIPTGR